jgi:hypothetical protein
MQLSKQYKSYVRPVFVLQSIWRALWQMFQ